MIDWQVSIRSIAYFSQLLSLQFRNNKLPVLQKLRDMMVKDLMSRDLNNENSPYISTPLSVRRGARDTPLTIHPDIHLYATPTPLRRVLPCQLYENVPSPVGSWSAQTQVEVRQRANSSNRQAIALSLRRSESSLVSSEACVQRERVCSEGRGEKKSGGGKRVQLSVPSEGEFVVRMTEGTQESPAQRRKVGVTHV